MGSAGKSFQALQESGSVAVVQFGAALGALVFFKNVDLLLLVNALNHWSLMLWCTLRAETCDKFSSFP